MADDEGGKTAPRFSGKASDAPDRTLTVRRARRSEIGRGPQLHAVRKDGWTPARRQTFMETLAATCNVSEAARVAGMNLSGAYYQRRRDPGFARDWSQALGIGYGELEALLLRQSLFGTEQEDIMLDGEGMVKSRKIRRGHDLAVGLRLLQRHSDAVGKMRAEEMRDRPDGDDAVGKMHAVLNEVRRRREQAGE